MERNYYLNPIFKIYANQNPEIDFLEVYKKFKNALKGISNTSEKFKVIIAENKNLLPGMSEHYIEKFLYSFISEYEKILNKKCLEKRSKGERLTEEELEFFWKNTQENNKENERIFSSAKE